MPPDFQVALVSMPFGSVDRPALGISLLKQGLTERGITCDVHYLLSELLDLTGLDTYRWLTDGVPYTSFAGDWCFTLPLYGRQPDLDWDYVQSILLETWRLSRQDVARIIAIREQTPAYIEQCLTTVDWNRYQLVGFTSTFTQNLASLALARALASNYPHLQIVFGGANWEDQMGKALFQQFSFVDFVCQGEADHSFPMLVDSLAQGSTLDHIPGLLYRDNTAAVVSTLPAEPVKDMDTVSIPDFSDYFAMLDKGTRRAQVTPALLLETSRGCWWGASSHCTFCGLNGNGMVFRSKSADRVLSELASLESTWQVHDISVVDNILDMQYFRTLLPRLAEQRSPRRLFFEVKANLSRQQVSLLRDSGIRNIQPGIESLSTHVLSLMRKGTDALRNVQLLKWCRELDVSVDWNILYGFPGERLEDYSSILETFRKIGHLQPPSGHGQIRLDRFSPYHSTPALFGILNVRPMAVFAYLYPFDDALLKQMVGYFDFDYDDKHTPIDASELLAAIDLWKRDYERPELRVEDDRSVLTITDTRQSCDPRRYQLAGFDRLIYVLCDRVSSVTSIQRRLQGLFPASHFSVEDIQHLLDWLEKHELVLCEGKHYLALGIYENFPDSLANAAEQRHRPRSRTTIGTVPVVNMTMKDTRTLVQRADVLETST
ncbi:Hopanoid C-3 methylase [Granulosicoccus antarcticus IMCC3135]|uniref:Hopanoid C-3 methylase n=1 Tax=Granulosicoccus antarcticus IMCC3135 TaxID=1192854 RepID=A0A2Z2NRB6_9GAMM|nr:Hopanoid C-3 methylase [Granulosicoccus antarcticus IMCC3135]